MTHLALRTSRRAVLRAALAAPFVGSALESFAQTASGPFALPALGYGFDALEPHIDAMTMQIHHDRHHQGYVNNLNATFAKFPELAKATDLPTLLKRLDRLPDAAIPAIRNNGGGHANHTLFWSLMKPGGGGAPTGAAADAINGTFGSFDKFKAAFEDAGAKRFGSGWVWLAVTKDKKLEVVSTPNQDTPLMTGGTPILGNDVWEHAYYLKYQNKRGDYLKAWWNVVNWDTVNAQLRMAK